MDKIRHVPSLQGLQALVEVSDSESFTLAAQTLCLTQSAVSRQIQQLESHFGVALITRTSRRLQLTAEGEQVLASARSILAQLKGLEDRISPHKRPFRIRRRAMGRAVHTAIGGHRALDSGPSRDDPQHR